MATKEQPQPENNVAQPEVAAPTMPAASYQAYPQYAAYVDPNKGKSKLLTFEYAFAMGSAVAAAFLLIDTMVSVFGVQRQRAGHGHGRLEVLLVLVVPGPGVQEHQEAGEIGRAHV